MKRKNPKTGKPFKHGDVREDGYIFWAYNTTIREDGTRAEKWLSPTKWNATKAKQRERVRKSHSGKVPINPITKEPYKMGDKTLDGLFYYSTDSYAKLDENGFKRPVFVTEAELARRRKRKKIKTALLRETKFKDFDYFIKSRFTNAKQRATRKKLKFSITEDYLKSIYPSDGLCPVFGVKMEALGDRLSSASLDRIDNDKGYEEGNVRWICMRANRVKGTATDEEILALADYIRSDR